MEGDKNLILVTANVNVYWRSIMRKSNIDMFFLIHGFIFITIQWISCNCSRRSFSLVTLCYSKDHIIQSWRPMPSVYGTGKSPATPVP